MPAVRPSVLDMIVVKTPSASYVRRAFEHALATIDDPGTPGTDRSQAAVTIQFLAMFVRFDERLIADTMNVIAHRLEDVDVVYFLLATLRDRVPDPSPLAVPLSRLAARAHRQGPRRSLLPIVMIAVEEPEWREALRDSWVHEALSAALDDGALSTAAMIIDKWIDGLEAIPGWLRGALEQRPELLGECGPSVVWQVHQAAPTVEGWKHLASIDRDHNVTPEAFGMTFRSAVETLGKAIDETPDDAMRVVLAIWRARLGNGE
jgi:hypothetical protein